MSIRVIPRTAVDGAMKLTRLPLDIAVALLPGNGAGARQAAGVAVDRVEAKLRDAAGIALHDRELRDDATRRRLAADERARELRLRAAAARERTEADARFSVRVDDAEEHRSAARQRAEDERRATERAEQQRTRAARATEQRRKAASRTVRAKAADAIEEKADEARVEQLEAEAIALQERERALTAQAEAQRLQDAATRKKATRKGR